MRRSSVVSTGDLPARATPSSRRIHKCYITALGRRALLAGLQIRQTLLPQLLASNSTCFCRDRSGASRWPDWPATAPVSVVIGPALAGGRTGQKQHLFLS
jgi:hypothetical protein